MINGIYLDFAPTFPKLQFVVELLLKQKKSENTKEKITIYYNNTMF